MMLKLNRWYCVKIRAFHESHLSKMTKIGAVASFHYNDVIMSLLAPQITSLTIVYLTIYSGPDQRKHQSFASLAFVRGIHRWPVNSPLKWPVTRKMFPFDDVMFSAFWLHDNIQSVFRIDQPGPWFNIKMSSYQYRKSHCGDKTVVRSSYLHSGISYTGKMTSFYWISPLAVISVYVALKVHDTFL